MTILLHLYIGFKFASDQLGHLSMVTAILDYLFMVTVVLGYLFMVTAVALP